MYTFMTMFDQIKESIKKLYIIQLLWLVIIQLFSCNSKKEDYCTSYRNGRYLYKTADVVIIIERKDSVQNEINPQTGVNTSTKIEWFGDCEYKLYYPANDSNAEVLKTNIISNKIIFASNEYYVFEASMNGSVEKVIDTIWVDNNY